MANPQALGATRRSLYVCQSCRTALRAHRPSPHSLPSPPTRTISQVHIKKIRIAQEEWKARATGVKNNETPSMLTRLDQRGYLNQIVGSRDELDHLLTNRRIGAYVGVDPTAPSMHVGHMVPFMALAFLYIHGYSVHYVLGGFTASIGDPTGRLTGRPKQDTSQRLTNVAALHSQLKRLGASIEKYAERRGYMREWAWRRSLTNNNSWWTQTSAKDFLFLMGRHARLGPMLGRDTVKTRLENDGMSFAEFSYPLVQAWDWWHLFKQGVQLQIGGSDQFGNILAGAEMIKTVAKHDMAYQSELAKNQKMDKMENLQTSHAPFGFTVPLLTTALGEKFGKSAGNAIWLDPSMTSPFELYQFFLRADDADVKKYLKLLTFVSLPEIDSLMQSHEKDASKRIPHHRLAREFVELIHGQGDAEKAEQEHRAVHSKGISLKDITESSAAKIGDSSSQSDGAQAFIHPLLNKHASPLSMETAGQTRIMLPRSLVVGQPLTRISWSANLVSSSSEAHRLIQAGGLYIGAKADAQGGMDEELSFTPARGPQWSLLSKYVIDERVLILRVGKWKLRIITIVPDEEFAKSGQVCPGWDPIAHENEQGSTMPQSGNSALGEESKDQTGDAAT